MAENTFVVEVTFKISLKGKRIRHMIVFVGVLFPYIPFL